jgi:rod shape-determining protein MreC
VYDSKKAVRRRRAVLGLLVACSLILLTAYFGESAGGGLHAVQRGFLEAVSPIQEGASRALKPVRDLFGWFGDTLDAKKQRDQLRTEVRQWRNQAIANERAQRKASELGKLVGLDRDLSLDEMAPVSARVTGRSPTVWFSTITIDKGSSDGVRPYQPVVTGDGLVGTVSTTVARDTSVVRLITDAASGVTARVASSDVTGVVKPAVGSPNDLRLEYLRHADNKVEVGQDLVTAGTSTGRLPSLFPPGLPIGKVTKVDQDEVDVFQRVHLRPFAQLRKLNFVQVLTKPVREPQT